MSGQTTSWKRCSRPSAPPPSGAAPGRRGAGRAGCRRGADAGGLDVDGAAADPVIGEAAGAVPGFEVEGAVALASFASRARAASPSARRGRPARRSGCRGGARRASRPWCRWRGSGAAWAAAPRQLSAARSRAIASGSWLSLSRFLMVSARSFFRSRSTSSRVSQILVSSSKTRLASLPSRGGVGALPRGRGFENAGRPDHGAPEVRDHGPVIAALRTDRDLAPQDRAERDHHGHRDVVRWRLQCVLRRPQPMAGARQVAARAGTGRPRGRPSGVAPAPASRSSGGFGELLLAWRTMRGMSS